MLFRSLLVPDRAVSRDQDRKYVLKVNDKNIVEYQAVETGSLFGSDRAILTGLKPGETIVVDGQFRLSPGARVQIAQPAPATKGS